METNERYALLFRMSSATERRLKDYARTHEWTYTQALREALKVAVEVDEEERTRRESLVA